MSVNTLYRFCIKFSDTNVLLISSSHTFTETAETFSSAVFTVKRISFHFLNLLETFLQYSKDDVEHVLEAIYKIRVRSLLEYKEPRPRLTCVYPDKELPLLL